MKNEPNRVIVVDDSKSVRIMLSEHLGKAGYHVMTAEDGNECLTLLKAERADVIVSDLEMPHLDGMELCEIIKTDSHLKKIYFIMLTSKSDLGHIVKGLDVGADDYIVKSTHIEELIARVRAGFRIKKMEQELEKTQQCLFHSEKMASIGQLAAGVAHEINNPMGFVTSNIRTFDKYINKLVSLVTEQNDLLESLNALDKAKELRKKANLDFIVEDIKDLIHESLEGAERVTEIVQSLKTFSRVGEQAYQMDDINECLENTLKVIWNELKYKVTVKKEYGKVPEIKCFPQQLNQVFMNILINAVQSIKDTGEIFIRTCRKNGAIEISISDTGCGISTENMNKLFEPFFTTKEVGKGTGLGLSIAYEIVKKHNGEIVVESTIGEGTKFIVTIPIVAESS